MSFLTKYGSFWGFLPLTVGRYFYVSPSASYEIEGKTYSASNDNDGLAPDRAFRTVQYAVDPDRSDPAVEGDVIVLLPGAHTSATTVTIATTGLTITGIPGSRQHFNSRMPASGKRAKSRITNTGTAGIIFTVSATDAEICNLHLAPTAAGGRGISLAPLSGAANRAYIHDVTVAMVGTASATTYGITVPAGVTNDLLEDVLISHCYFQSGLDTSSGANGSAVNALGTTSGMTIEQSTFELKGTAAWANAILLSQAGSKGIVVRDCDTINPTNTTTVITTFLNATGQTIDGSTQIHRCYIAAGTDTATATAIVDVVLTETYLASSGGGALANNN